jgi:hypothetical protein
MVIRKVKRLGIWKRLAGINPNVAVLFPYGISTDAVIRQMGTGSK